MITLRLCAQWTLHHFYMAGSHLFRQTEHSIIAPSWLTCRRQSTVFNFEMSPEGDLAENENVWKR